MLFSYLDIAAYVRRTAAIVFAVLMALTLSACDLLPLESDETAVNAEPPAPTAENVTGISRLREVADPVEGRYLVQLMQRTRQEPFEDVLNRLVTRYNVDIDMKFRHVFYGFAAAMSAEQAELIAADADVAYVEQDNYVVAAEISPVTGASSAEPWGLQQLSLGAESYQPAYQGIGVNIYVLSTGVNSKSPELLGRVGRGVNAGFTSPWLAELLGKKQPGLFMQLLGNQPEPADPNDTEDCHGHGTRVATMAAGSQLGTAPMANIRPLKALGCDGRGTTSSVVQTLEWLRGRYQRPALLLLPISGSRSKVMDQALRRLMKKDILPIVAAGDGGDDACETSPAGVRIAITVGGYDRNGSQLVGANGGDCVDLMLPGEAVDSIDHQGERQLSTGSSAAAAYAAGIIAQLREAYGLEGRVKIERRLAEITASVTLEVDGQPLATKTLDVPQR